MVTPLHIILGVVCKIIISLILLLKSAADRGNKLLCKVEGISTVGCEAAYTGLLAKASLNGVSEE